MNRINQKLQEDNKILSIYFSAGYPNLNDTVQIIQDLEKTASIWSKSDYPLDPLADGPTIQESSTQALHNGIHTSAVWPIKDIRKSVSIPLIIMGYFNPMLQYVKTSVKNVLRLVSMDSSFLIYRLMFMLMNIRNFWEIRTNKRTLDYTSNFSWTN
jgi:tryptophan synthase alpha subunit